MTASLSPVLRDSLCQCVHFRLQHMATTTCSASTNRCLLWATTSGWCLVHPHIIAEWVHSPTTTTSYTALPHTTPPTTHPTQPSLTQPHPHPILHSPPPHNPTPTPSYTALPHTTPPTTHVHGCRSLLPQNEVEALACVDIKREARVVSDDDIFQDVLGFRQLLLLQEDLLSTAEVRRTHTTLCTTYTPLCALPTHHSVHYLHTTLHVLYTKYTPLCAIHYLIHTILCYTHHTVLYTI